MDVHRMYPKNYDDLVANYQDLETPPHLRQHQQNQQH